MINRLGNIDDSSILAIIADRAESADVYPLEPDEFDELKARLQENEARRVAELLISRQDPLPTDTQKVKDAVKGLRDWVKRNRTVHAPLKNARNRPR